MARSARGLPGLLALTLLALALPTLAAAQTAAGAQVPPDSIVKPDPPGVWRILGPDAESTTSTCIGRPKTPICAVETVLACFLREDVSLCRTTMIGTLPELSGVPNKHLPFKTYRFVGSMTVGDKGWWRAVELRFGGYYRSILPHTKPGDLAVFVHDMSCRTRTSCLSIDRKAPPNLYGLRRVDGTWRVIDSTYAVY